MKTKGPAHYTMIIAGCFDTRWGGTEAFSFADMWSFSGLNECSRSNVDSSLQMTY